MKGKTKAGQFLNQEGGKLIRERLTMYGSQAVISLDNMFVVVYHCYFLSLYLHTVPLLDKRLIRHFWSNIV